MAVTGCVKTVKGLALFSVVSGLLVLFVSTWTFISLLVSRNQMLSESRNSSTVYSTAEDESIDDQGTFRESRTIEHRNLSNYSQFWATLDQISYHFWIKMTVCTWLVNIGALLQIMSSFTVLCPANNDKVQSRSKYLVGLHFITLIILIVCLFIPLGYDRENETTHSVTSFNDKIVKSFEKFSEKGGAFIIFDVNAYYFVVVFDIIITFVLMVCTCCFMRYEPSPYDSV